MTDPEVARRRHMRTNKTISGTAIVPDGDLLAMMKVL
jgi:hypothetical protein